MSKGSIQGSKVGQSKGKKVRMEGLPIKEAQFVEIGENKKEL